jgi:hypothetical protein
MKKVSKIGLDFIVDKLTNSIENVVTGDSFSTEISIVTFVDLKSITRKNNWQFDWKFEYKQPQREVYKLTILNNKNIIQGLLSLDIKKDHVYITLLRVPPSTKGNKKCMQEYPAI